MSAVLPQQLVALPGTYETDYSQTSTTTSFAVFKCKKSRITTLSSDLLARPNFKHVNKTFPLHISSRNDCISSIELSEYSQRNAVDRSAPTCLPWNALGLPHKHFKANTPNLILARSFTLPTSSRPCYNVLFPLRFAVLNRRFSCHRVNTPEDKCKGSPTKMKVDEEPIW